jgi:hypothetical protein
MPHAVIVLLIVYVKQSLVTRDDDTSDEEDDEAVGDAPGKETAELIPTKEGKDDKG